MATVMKLDSERDQCQVKDCIIDALQCVSSAWAALNDIENIGYVSDEAFAMMKHLERLDDRLMRLRRTVENGRLR